LRALLGGWIELGVPPGSEDRVRLRLEEDMLLLARLDWLGSMMQHPQPLKRLQAGEAPVALLAAALGLGTPEEARTRLPQIVDPESAIGLALWLQAVAPDGRLEHDLQLQWLNRCPVLTAKEPREADLEPWRAAFAPLALECELDRIMLRPGALKENDAEISVAHAQA